MLFLTVNIMNINAVEQATYSLLINFTVKFSFLYV